ncbi:hypothetical protein D3C76_1808660 [compost metagenome]
MAENPFVKAPYRFRSIPFAPVPLIDYIANNNLALFVRQAFQDQEADDLLLLPVNDGPARIP